MKLWLWKNFVDGKPEYWAFDNPFPVHLDCCDPQTLGEPCGYAIFKPSRAGRSDVTEEQVLERINRAKEDQIMSKYTAAQIKNWDVDTEAPTVGWIPARPINPTGIITRCRHALGVLTGRYDVLDWEQEARAVIAKATVEVK